MDVIEIDTDGFFRIDGRPALSYDQPRLICSPSGIKILRRRVEGQGIYHAGAALFISAVSKSWLSKALWMPSASMICEGRPIADVGDPEMDKDGVGSNYVDRFRLELETDADARVRLRFTGSIGEPSFQGGINPPAEGLTVTADIAFDRALFFPAAVRR